MADIADMAHRSRQVAGTDEQGVDALDGGDFFQLRQGGRRFQLNNREDGAVGARGVVATALRASVAFSTNGNIRVCAPMSSARLICTRSFQARRTTGQAGVPPSACRIW